MGLDLRLPSREERVKIGALAVLVVQTTSLALVARYSRTQAGPMYLVSTAVVLSEALKFVTSFLLVSAEQGGLMAGMREVYQEVILKPEDSVKMLVPALLFTLQNNLGYFALTHLDVATYQVLYQLKILTTAIFAVVLLQRPLRCVQWVSLLVLVAGVALVQLSGLKASSSSSSGHGNSLVGLVAVLMSCLSSGLAGVYFEKVLKDSKLSVWIRNMELALFSVLIGLVGVYYVDEVLVSEHGFLYGYNRLVWTAVTLQAAGGIIVAVVIKYADNVIKGFATSISIVLSCLISIHLHDFTLTPGFFLGATLVLSATYLYGSDASLLTWATMACCCPVGFVEPGKGFGDVEEEEQEAMLNKMEEEGRRRQEITTPQQIARS